MKKLVALLFLSVFTVMLFASACADPCEKFYNRIMECDKSGLLKAALEKEGKKKFIKECKEKKGDRKKAEACLKKSGCKEFMKCLFKAAK